MDQRRQGVLAPTRLFTADAANQSNHGNQSRPAQQHPQQRHQSRTAQPQLNVSATSDLARLQHIERSADQQEQQLAVKLQQRSVSKTLHASKEASPNKAGQSEPAVQAK